jgi:hypothetical protein
LSVNEVALLNLIHVSLILINRTIAVLASMA